MENIKNRCQNCGIVVKGFSSEVKKIAICASCAVVLRTRGFLYPYSDPGTSIIAYWEGALYRYTVHINKLLEFVEHMGGMSIGQRQKQIREIATRIVAL